MTRVARPGTGPTMSRRRLRLRDMPMILMYHSVASVGADPNSLCVTPDRFAEQMAWLDRNGLRGVSVGTLLARMRAGRARGLVGITFDDGYQAIMETALPELRSRGFSATVFVISGLIGGTNRWDEGPSWPLVTADQVRVLAAAGFEIGSHSVSHPRLAGLPADRLHAEVAGSRADLRALSGADVRGFAYPYGSMDAAARAAVRKAGFDYACAVQTSWADLGLWALPRVYIGQRDTAARLAGKRLLNRGRIALRGARS